MNWLTSLAIHFVLNQLAALGMGANWGAMKTAANAYVNGFLTGWLSALQPGVDAVIDGVIDAIAHAAQDTAALQTIVDDLAANNWTKALSDLEAMIVAAAHPHQAQALAGLKLLNAA